MPAALIEEYIQRFWGYGSWKRPVWFLGMEEGVLNGQAGPEQMEHRLQIWLARGCLDLEEAPGFCNALGHAGYFANPPKPQPTWDKLARIYLSLRGQPAMRQDEHIYPFRLSRFGRGVDDFTAIEMFPLPAASADEWPYGDWADEQFFLLNRDAYSHSVYAHRAASLWRKIQLFRPKVLLCYGGGHEELYEGVIRTRFVEAAGDLNISHAHIQATDTRVFLINHVTRGVTNDQLAAFGNFIGEFFAQNRNQL